MRQLQTEFTPYPTEDLVAIGDSLTFNYLYPVYVESYYPERAAVALRALGAPMRARNMGISGQTSAQIAARAAVTLQYGTPALGVIWAGQNDSGTSWADTAANIETVANAMLGVGCERVIVCATHYINFDTGSGGDNTSGALTSAPSGDRATLRTAQNSAYTALAAANPGKVAWCDLWQYMHDYLAANPTHIGVDTYYHVAASNIHLNAVGEQLVADALLATVQAQDGWLDALSS
jgi:lysophospholipase L1-like esterase